MTALLFGAKCVQCFCNAFYRAWGRVVIKSPLLLPAPFQDDVPRAGWKYVQIKTTSDNGILATMLFLVYKEKVISIQENQTTLTS